MIRKSVFILIVFHIAGLMQSCVCSCDNAPLYIDYQYLLIDNLDNADRYPMIIEEDSMKREAVAFALHIVSDTVSCYTPFSSGTIFAGAYACECILNFETNQQIEQISIETLNELGGDFEGQQDVTDFFVADLVRNGRALHSTLDQIIAEIPKNRAKDISGTSLKVYLKGTPTAEQAQFTFCFQMAG